ncbi:MAG: HD domain-containing protein [Defluviitaleaceae bacterium]|nr:HD domain-containing protein [Defluviitaleaceae bacterium]MCL2239672.1 HD domain-containing protein [Defluviitaleaceae bacterium]
MRYLEDVRENEHVLGHYLCRQKQSLKTRGGKTYYSLRLSDKTGQMDAKVWELNNDIQAFEEGDMIKIDAQVVTFQNELQLKVIKLRKSLEGEYIPLNYVPCTEKDIDALYGEVLAYIKSVEHPKLRALLEGILVKNEDRAQAFKSHSAAKQMHHSYMGGLLEHTLNVVQICDFMSSRYKHLNRDLIITSALLHDIGKIYELSPMPMNDYTDDGQMLGHITIGVEMVTEEAGKIPDFPHELASLLKHSLLAHHGELEFGSPKLPATIEAFLLHCADNMDAKLKSFEEILDKDSTAGPWTGYQKVFNRYIRRSDFS